MYNFLPGVPMAFDHSIADPRQSGLTVKPIPGKAAKKREYSKIDKFRNNLALQGTRFEPFVLESFGRWGYRTRIIFKDFFTMILGKRTSLTMQSVAEAATTLTIRRNSSVALFQIKCNSV